MLRMHYYTTLATARLTFVALLCSLLACSYAKMPPETLEGQGFPDHRIDEIEVGMSPDSVREILGDPYEVVGTDLGESWRYYDYVEQYELIRYLMLIPVKKLQYSGTKEASILFYNDAVKDVFYEHKRLR